MTNFFKKTRASEITSAKGPSFKDQITAMAKGEYWFVLNSFILAEHCPNDSELTHRANAFKHALQTHGPCPENKTLLPDFRHNEGAAKNKIFHGHILNRHATYVLEWTLLDKENRIIALINFAKHENYSYRQSPLSEAEQDRIISHPKNIKILAHAQEKILEAREKFERTENNYRLQK